MALSIRDATREDLERLEELEKIIESGEASNVSEAREVYYSKNRTKRRG